MLIGIIREGKKPADKRVALTPSQCAQIQKQFPSVRINVQSSPIRTFDDSEYLDYGIEVVEKLDHCDILLGVKEVTVDELIPSKTYFFFSHTFKKQLYNRKLLKTILEKKIRLIDYELLAEANGRRLIGFGRYAGVVGAYNGIRAYGLLTKTFDIRPAHLLFDRKEMALELEKVQLPKHLKIVMTGGGRVAGGILEILSALNIQSVEPNDFLMHNFNQPSYTQLSVKEYVRSVDGRPFTTSEFYNNPMGFESAFKPFTHAADIYISGHYWDDESPMFITAEDIQDEKFKIKLIADVSCDINGPIASTLRPSTIADPLYGYDRATGLEVPFGAENSIGVMAVDNLPCELPRDASEDFGNEFMENILPHLLNNDIEGVLWRATEAKDGVLLPDFQYLQEYVDSL